MKDYTINKDYPLVQEQNEAIEFISHRPQSILSLSTGLGKTLTSLTFACRFMTVHPEYHTIIVCPAAANKSFIKELSTKLFEQYTIKTRNLTTIMPNSRFTIFNYSSIEKYMEDIRKINDTKKIFFILDEVHNLQNPSSKLYQVMHYILGFSRYRLGLTATPLLNDLMGLYYMTELICPGYFPSEFNFKYRYMQWENKKMKVRGRSVTVPQVVGYKHLDELNNYCKELIFVRKKTYNLEFKFLETETDELLYSEYLRCAKGLVVETETSSRVKEWGPRLHDLQQVIDNCHPDTMHVDFSNKEKLLCKLIKSLIEKGESLLVYCEYYNTIDRVEFILNKIGYKLGVNALFKITGQIDKNVRAKVEDKLVPGSVVLVTKAGTASINLQKANNVIFYDIPFAIADVIQMVGRIARMDTKFDKQKVWFIESKNTIDTYKRLRMQSRTSLIDDVICHDNNLPTEVLQLDLSSISDLKKELLWKFGKKKET